MQLIENLAGQDLVNYFATEFTNQHIHMTQQVKTFLSKLNGKDLLEYSMEEALIPSIQKDNIIARSSEQPTFVVVHL